MPPYITQCLESRCLIELFAYIFFLLLQEDVPEEFAGYIQNFISHNRIGPNGVEVSDLYSEIA